MEAVRRVIFLVVLLLSISTSFAKQGIMIISDLDDTVKITETNRPIRMVINGFFTLKAYAAMPELYEHMQHLYVDRTVILTSSPNLLRGRIFKLFDKFNMDIDQLITRSLRTESDGAAYKYKNIVNQLESNPDKNVILIGDDSGEDHEIYHRVKQDYPDRVVEIYIRPIRGRHLAQGIKKYLSAFDIALSEYKAGRLGYTELRDISDLVANHSKDKEVIAKKSFCPKSGSINSKGVEELIRVVTERIRCICRDRKIKR